MTSLDNYRCKLIEKILHATNYEQIKRFILIALRSLDRHKINGHLINRFIDKTTTQFDDTPKSSINVRTEANIKFAKLQLTNLKRHFIEPKDVKNEA